MNPDPALLDKARRCYLAVGWLDDACRCSELLGDAAGAARLHEQQERWEAAALAYTRAGLWREAARCFERCELFAEAAECLLKTDERLQAAWLLAEKAHRFAHAREVVQHLAPGSPGEVELAVELVLARCETGLGDSAAAARRLQQVLRSYPAVEVLHERRRIEEWSLAVAEALRRPDLSALVYATATRAGTPGARERWETWALATLGDASGVPPPASAGEN